MECLNKYKIKMEPTKKIVKCVIDEEGRLGITAIGLVSAPAIEENWIALNAVNEVKLAEVNNERKMLYGAALIPNKEILRIDANMNEYYIVFDEDTIYQCAHLFLKKNLQHSHTIEHEFAITGCTVVESWIVEDSNSDKSTAMGMTLPKGTWMLGVKVDDEQVWSDVKAGTIKGFSIEGMFNEVEVKMASNVETLFLKELEALLNSHL